MSFSSNAVVAKARAIFGRSLTTEDYVQLSSKETVADVCMYLKQTPRYAAALSSANPQTVHREQLEGLLRKGVFDIFESFHRFDFTESMGFFHYIVTQLEIEQILLAIQSVSGGSSDNFIAALPMFVNEHSDVDLAGLGTAKNLIEAADYLRGSVYEKAIGELLVSAAETGRLNICECERRLYTQYYMILLKAVEEHYKGSDKKELKRLVLRSIDMENVVTLYRYSRLFKMPADKLSDKLIRFKYRLSDEAIEELAAQKDTDKIAAELSAMGYGTKGEIPPTVEALTGRISLEFLKKTIRLSQSASAVHFALAECLKIELKNVKTVIEGIRYKMKGSDILDMLVI